jgi:hypothetical protein
MDAVRATGFPAFQFQENPHAAVPLFTTGSLTNQSLLAKAKGFAAEQVELGQAERADNVKPEALQ